MKKLLLQSVVNSNELDDLDLDPKFEETWLGIVRTHQRYYISFYISLIKNRL